MQTLARHDTSLRRTLERLVGETRARSVKIASVTSTPSPFVTLFPAEVLSLTLDDGEQLKLFVKHLGNEQSDHPEKQRRDREIRVYEELLRAPGLPVVTFYGSRRNRTTRRYELYLEYVDDWCLKYHELRHWFDAARRLGDLHAHFATRPELLARCDFLLRFDAAYFSEWAERALVAVGEYAASLAEALRPIVRRYERVASLLARQPATLVHNDLAPKNIIVDRSRLPSRICLVDWEMAGIGCGLLDLVDLKYGLDEASDEAMCSAYSTSVGDCGLLPERLSERRRLFAACELHKTLYRSAFARSWGVPGDRLAQWVEEAARHWAGI